MKRVATACLAIILIGSITSGSAWARGGGGHGGGGFGGGYHGGGHGWGHYGGGWGHGHWGYYGGIGIGVYGFPGYYGWPYYPPYYPPYYAYPPAVITAPSSPPVYIEQGGGQPAPQNQSGYWYYCRGSQAYYPHVKQCPGGWQQVAPQPQQ